MGSMYRSDKMSLCEFFIQTETAYESLTRLGHLCCVQFNDMNEAAANMREFVSEVCRCEEMMRRLRFMYVEMVKDDIFVPEMSQPPTPMGPHDMLNYEAVLEKWENDLIEMTSNLTVMMKGYMELSEMHYVLTNVGPILGNAEIHLSQTVHAELQKEGHLAVITGVVNRDRSFPFQVMLWRIAKGNIFYKEANEDRVIYDPTTRQGMRKVAFLLICQGEQLTIRTKKVCTGFRANLYPCPRTAAERDEMSMKLDVRLKDMEKSVGDL